MLCMFEHFGSLREAQVVDNSPSREMQTGIKDLVRSRAASAAETTVISQSKDSLQQFLLFHVTNQLFSGGK